MTEVFADTYYFIAVLGPDGPERRRALQVGGATSGRRLITTAWVMTEVGSFMRRPHERTAFVELVKKLEAINNALLLPAEADLWSRGLKLYESRLDKEWSLVDCVSFVVMNDRKLTDALTGDHHFEQAGFRALLK
jgi:predicted nucleic acid-binding protein